MLALLMSTGVLTGVAEHRLRYYIILIRNGYLLQSFKKNIVQHGIKMDAYDQWYW